MIVNNLNSKYIEYGIIRYAMLLFILTISMVGYSQDIEDSTNPYPDYQEDVFMDWDFERNLASPAVPSQAKDAVSKYQQKVARSLQSKYTVDVMRDNDIFVVSIPTDDLFLPNDTLLMSSASALLTPLAKLMDNAYMYKIIVALHTDDTGSELYRENLSAARMYSIYDWLMDSIDAGVISEDIVIIPYSMGSSSPLVANDTRTHRRENRRLEFYFVPGPEMIKLAGEHKLK